MHLDCTGTDADIGYIDFIGNGRKEADADILVCFDRRVLVDIDIGNDRAVCMRRCGQRSRIGNTAAIPELFTGSALCTIHISTEHQRRPRFGLSAEINITEDDIVRSIRVFFACFDLVTVLKVARMIGIQIHVAGTLINTSIRLIGKS